MKIPEPEFFLHKILDIGRRYEFSTFRIGVRIPGPLPHNQKSQLGRPLKRSLGRMLERHYWPDRNVHFQDPQLEIELDVAGGSVSAVSRALFIGGRYRKYSRRISCAQWTHMACSGKGCPVCNFTGRIAEGSVSEIIAPPLLDAAQGSDWDFHGMGREDVDARMLGAGRPFVVEIKNPRIRTIALSTIASRINQKGRGEAEVAGTLCFVPGEAVPTIKGASSDKSYHALVVTADCLPPEAARRVASLSGLVVQQRTPCRVSHRRATKVRKRKILKSSATVLDARNFIWSVRTEGGTYVKELATGDGGRTQPSLAGTLGTPAVVTDLDVTAVHFKAPWE